MVYTAYRRLKSDASVVYGLRPDGTWERATTDAHKCPDCDVKLEEGKCPKCGKRPKATVPPGSKPYAGEHACRLNDPGKYEQFRRQNRKVHGGKKTLGFIFGRAKGKTAWELQALRFPKKDWDEDAARASCKAKGGAFEPAAEKDGPPEVKDFGVALVNRDGIPMPYLAGSWESIEADLEEDAKEWLEDNGVKTDGMDITLLGTFDGSGVVCLRDRYGYYGSGAPKLACYEGDWAMEGDDPEWQGAPRVVDLVVTAEVAGPAEGTPNAAAAPFVAKGLGGKGRLARRNESRLQQAADLMHVVKGADELKHHTRASAEKAHQLVGDVLQDVRGGNSGRTTEGGDATPNTPTPKPAAGGAAATEAAAKQLLGHLLKGDGLDGGTARLLLEELGRAAEAADGAALASFLS